MGIESGGNFLYLNVSCGLLTNKKKGVEAKAYFGTLVGLERKEDVFEGKTMQKIVCSIKDNKSDEIAKIKWTEESYFSVGFFSQVPFLDVSQPFRFSVSGSAENEKISFCWLQQFDKNLDRIKDFPKPAKVKVGRGEISDWSKPLAEIDKIIGQINEKLKEAGNKQVVESLSMPSPIEGTQPFEGGLPF